LADPIKPLTPQQTTAQENKAAAEGYLHRDLVGLDQFVNVLADGKPDETISSRAARADLKGKWWGRTMSRFLNLFQPDHGAKAEAGDAERAETIEKAENSSGGIAP
jgi:hypothetical protein